MNRRVLITGAAGFLGGHLISNLLKTQAQITAVDICEPNKNASNFGNNLKWVRADITTDNITQNFAGIEVVYHLAGRFLPGNSSQVFDDLCKLNVTGTENVLRMAKKCGAQRFIHISSAAICGSSDGKVITENDVRPITSYGFSKLKSEEVVKDFCDTRIEYVILRPTAFFGENHLGSLYEMAKMIQRKNFVMIGNGRNHMNFLYVNDLTDILVRAATECKMTNQIFLVADSPVKLKEFTNYTAKELGLEPSMFYIPKFVGLSAGFGFDVLSRILNRPMPLSVARVKNMTNDSRYSGAKLLELLSAKFQYGVYHGWTRTLNWYRSESLL